MMGVPVGSPRPFEAGPGMYGGGALIEERLDRLIAVMERCELLLARIAKQGAGFPYSQSLRTGLRQSLEQKAND